MGGANTDWAWRVTALASGGAIVAGEFRDTAYFGTTTLTSAGSTDAFVAHIDPNGSWTWAVRVGGASQDGANDVGALADGGAIVSGYFGGTATFGTTTLTSAGNSDAFVARIDPTGAWTWATGAGGAEFDGAVAVSTLADGGAIVAGSFRGTATFGTTTLTSGGGEDAFVARIDPTGAWTWATRAGGADFEFPEAVHALADGAAIVVGSFGGTATFGTTTLTSAGSSDAFVARIDPTGTWTWATRAGGADGDSALGVRALVDGAAIVVGRFNDTATFGTTSLTSAGSSDAFVARIDPTGSWTWAARGRRSLRRRIWRGRPRRRRRPRRGLLLRHRRVR